MTKPLYPEPAVIIKQHGLIGESKFVGAIWVSRDNKNNEPYSFKIIHWIVDIVSVKKIVNRIEKFWRFIQCDSKRYFGKVNIISSE